MKGWFGKLSQKSREVFEVLIYNGVAKRGLQNQNFCLEYYKGILWTKGEVWSNVLKPIQAVVFLVLKRTPPIDGVFGGKTSETVKL